MNYEDISKKAIGIVNERLNSPTADAWIALYNKVYAQLIIRECIWAFGETRTEPSLEKYILNRLGIIK